MDNLKIFDPFSSKFLDLVFSILHVLNRTESLKLILPVCRYGELVFQVEEVFDHNQRLCLILLSWRERGGGHWKILKTSLRLPEAPFIPEMVAGFISLFLFFLRRIGNFQLTLPLGNGLTLFSRIQDISDPNHRNRNLHAIQIGTRSKTGYYLLFKARFK